MGRVVPRRAWTQRQTFGGQVEALLDLRLARTALPADAVARRDARANPTRGERRPA